MAGDKRSVSVLMGGTSAEREVSLSTGRQILGALDEARYTIGHIDTADTAAMFAALAHSPPDVAVIALHGPGGEDGSIQGLLETLRVPYTGSGVLASALAMDKAMCKRLLTPLPVAMPQDVTLSRGSRNPRDLARHLPLPWIVKPTQQGSTIGMTVVQEPSELDAALANAFEYGSVVLVEQFIAGTEITVPILGNREMEVLPIVEIVPHSGFYDYHDKYTPGATDEIVPARLSERVAEEARRIACLCHQTLGCRGMSRTDMIVDSRSQIWTLEVNTIPGMTPTSLLPRSAQAAGYSFSQLLDKLIALALTRE